MLAGKNPTEKLQFVSEGRLLTEVSLLCVRCFCFVLFFLKIFNLLGQAHPHY